MNTPHPELETLAELAEQAESTGTTSTEPTASAEPTAASGPTELDDARAHVAGCPACTAEIAALRSVQRSLRSLPDIAMPDDVTARLESALRAEATTAAGGGSVTVLPQHSKSSSSSQAGNRRTPHFSAAAAVTLLVVVALGAGIGVLVSNGGGQSKSTSSAPALATNKTTVLASGHDYARATIRNQVAALVLTGVPAARNRYSGLENLAGADTAAGAASQPAASATPSASTSASASAAPGTYGTGSGAGAQPAPTAPGGPLASSAALKACIVALVNQPVTPILVDYATFEGKPATVIVLPDPDTPNILDLYVEAYTADCVTKGDVTFFATLPATAP